MRIALIYPATAQDRKVLPDSMPMGLLYLAAAAEHGYDAKVDVFDGRHGPAFPSPAAMHGYDLIGFSALTMQINTALKMAGRARQDGYKGILAFGGPHASVAPEHLKSKPFLDAIFLGEAEETFLQYLRHLEGRPHHLERIWVRNARGQWDWHPGEHFIEDLDTLPWPAREKYGDLPRQLGQINLCTTRGCPYQCNFCQPTKQILFGQRVRRRSPRNIVVEIQDAVERYGIRAFSIDDDTFTFHPRAIGEFCDLVAPLKLAWSCQSRSDIGRDTLIRMRESGCAQIIVGVESGSQRMLDLMNKKNTVAANVEFIRTCNDLGIETWCNMMAGYPGETEADLQMSLEFIRSTQPTRTNVSQVTPFPGTHLWTQRQGDIAATDWDDIARHVHRPKFKSLKSRQPLIKYYITLMNKPSHQPVGADLVCRRGWRDWLYRHIPYLLRLVVHGRQWVYRRLLGALDMARAGRLEPAIRRLRLLAFCSTTRWEARGHLAWILLSSGRSGEAVGHYRRLLAAQPQEESLHCLLARALHESGRKEEALDHLRRFLERSPHGEQAAQLLKRFVEQG